ncbi:MAG: DUF937 domain-containing protein [Cellulomonas sp.]|uniref:DUF937 domain-containing protein n=1 Tax=Cellulomonas sp. TaxID=40001 RepID=UPI002588AE4D|nr:DUF937 domain-containing protein [Cellulomonas sp.]MCR6647558.1 DUF937 domain-containing protein [Cellulomonas sp.]MCR6703548.1 DUF937 domain-containing protein [Cellulomonas sp.]
MSEIDEILAQIPLPSLAAQLGVDERTAEAAVRSALPALVGGLQSNAASPDGAASLAGAIEQHPATLFDGGLDLGGLDLDDGAKILGHIFGGGTDQVAQQVDADLGAQLGGVPEGAAGLGGGSGSLVSRLLPMLAPIVMAFLAKRLQGGGGPTSSAPSSGGGLQDMLGSILGGLGGR